MRPLPGAGVTRDKRRCGERWSQRIARHKATAR